MIFRLVMVTGSLMLIELEDFMQRKHQKIDSFSYNYDTSMLTITCDGFLGEETLPSFESLHIAGLQ